MHNPNINKRHPSLVSQLAKRPTTTPKPAKTKYLFREEYNHNHTTNINLNNTNNNSIHPHAYIQQKQQSPNNLFNINLSFLTLQTENSPTSKSKIYPSSLETQSRILSSPKSNTKNIQNRKPNPLLLMRYRLITRRQTPQYYLPNPNNHYNTNHHNKSKGLAIKIEENLNGSIEYNHTISNLCTKSLIRGDIISDIKSPKKSEELLTKKQWLNNLKDCLQAKKFDIINSKQPNDPNQSNKSSCDSKNLKIKKVKHPMLSPQNRIGKMNISTQSHKNPHLQHDFEVYFALDEEHEVNDPTFHITSVQLNKRPLSASVRQKKEKPKRLLNSIDVQTFKNDYNHF